MPLSNSTPDNYVLGKGRVFLALRDSSGNYDDFRFIGNCPSFTVTPSSDTLTHVSSTGGINVEDRDIQISSTLALAFTTDNIVAENLALFFQGTVDQQTVTSATGKTQSIPTPLKGYNYTLGNILQPDLNVTVTSVQQGATTLVLGTDYTVDGRSGLVAFPTSSSIIEGTPITVTYNLAAATRPIVNARAQTITAALMFISTNPDTGKGLTDNRYLLPYVRVSPDGDFGLISDSWLTLGFTGSVLQAYDTSGNPIPRISATPLSAT